MILALLIAGALAITAFSGPRPQTPRTTTAIRRIPVNARTVTALPGGKNFVVDLTQRGVKYEFDAKAGQIDFSRVKVRTAQGEVAIGAFLERRIPRAKLAAHPYTSRSFIIGTSAAGSTRIPSRNRSDVDCYPNGSCVCEGEIDCETMLDTLHCTSYFCILSSDRPVFCFCDLI
jgi:hypothetical protein